MRASFGGKSRFLAALGMTGYLTGWQDPEIEERSRFLAVPACGSQARSYKFSLSAWRGEDHTELLRKASRDQESWASLWRRT
jgi:hypothetical protein